jgi:ribosome-associated protein
MTSEDLKRRPLETEILFSASRSSGPGGQNINKLNTKVELRFNVSASVVLTEEEKGLIFEKLEKKINKDGELILVSQSERTQLMNKKRVTARFFEIISKALTPRKKRRATRPTADSIKKRLESKRGIGVKKKLRKIQGDDAGE